MRDGQRRHVEVQRRRAGRHGDHELGRSSALATRRARGTSGDPHPASSRVARAAVADVRASRCPTRTPARMLRPGAAALRRATRSWTTSRALLATRPARARRAWWPSRSRYRVPGPGARGRPAAELDALKLYQPAHGDFNLVAATLVCRSRAARPRRRRGGGRPRRFVLRRLDADGPSWRGSTTRLGDGALVARGRRRRAHRARRRRGAAAAVPRPLRDGEEKRARCSSGSSRPRAWRVLRRVGAPLDAAGRTPSRRRHRAPSEPRGARRSRRTQRLLARRGQGGRRAGAHRGLALRAARLRRSSCRDASPALWNAIVDRRAAGARRRPATLYDMLAGDRRRRRTTWRAALSQAWDAAARSSTGDSGKAPRAGDRPRRRRRSRPGVLRGAHGPGRAPAERSSGRRRRPVGAAAPVPKLDPRGRRALRHPLRLPRPAVRAAAPGRRQRADARRSDRRLLRPRRAGARRSTSSLPVDTSIKDLRKLRKNVNFLISDQLRRADEPASPTSRTSLDGEFGPARALDVGLICSFSIPIITICALIVLMIFVSPAEHRLLVAAVPADLLPDPD